MIQIPSDIRIDFDALLVKKGIPERFHFNYRKWLRYYLDFCHKYHFQQSNKENLSHFIKKLQEKNQTKGQQRQASHAVSLYYEIAQFNSQSNSIEGTIPTKKEGLKLTHANWKTVFNDLNSEIKLRHYSPKTLKAYTG